MNPAWTMKSLTTKTQGPSNYVEQIMTCNCVAHPCTEEATTVGGLCAVCELIEETGGECRSPDVPVVFDAAPVAEVGPEPTIEQFDKAVDEGDLV